MKMIGSPIYNSMFVLSATVLANFFSSLLMRTYPGLFLDFAINNMSWRTTPTLGKVSAYVWAGYPPPPGLVRSPKTGSWGLYSPNSAFL